LFKFAEMATFGNVYQNYDTQTPVVVNGAGEEVVVRGAWAAHFGNSNPITLELACGGGEYTLGLGAMYPHRNFVGVDIKGGAHMEGGTGSVGKGYGQCGFSAYSN
jgi:tRNA (guanine-N7-)-methyltransferase